MNEARKLYQLQEIDQELDVKREALARVVSQLGEDSILKEAAAAREQAHRWLMELEKAQRASEAEADDLAFKRGQLEKKLYGGKVTNVKELTGLQEEFELLKSKLREKEDRVLEVMGEVEAAQKSLQMQESKFTQVEAMWRDQQQSLVEERSTLEAALSRLKEKREKLAAEIEPNPLSVYEGLRVGKLSRVVARVEQGRCQGCRLSLSIAEISRARGSGLVQCSSCHRILCLE